MEKLEQEYIREICKYCNNQNDDECSIRIFRGLNQICCKCVNYTGERKKKELNYSKKRRVVW